MQKLLTFFSSKMLAYMPYLMIKVLTACTLTNDIVSFEQLGPVYGPNLDTAPDTTLPS